MYTYAVPESLRAEAAVGKRVMIPFGQGNQAITGYIVEPVDEEPDFATKPVIDVLDVEPVVSEELIRLAFWLHETTHCNLYRAFRAVSPPGDEKKITALYLDPEDQRFTKEELEETWGAETPARIRDGLRAGTLRLWYEIEFEGKYKEETRVFLTRTPAHGALPERAHKQKEILSYLETHGETPRPVLLRNTQTGSSTLHALREKGYVDFRQVRVPREVITEEIQKTRPMTLTPEQQNVYDAVTKAPGGKFLIHGVTGSGKTELYLQLAQHALEQNRQTIVLVPEISLTPQTIARFTGRFGRQIAVLHSRLSPAERFEQWKRIKNREVTIAVGARSAVFAPFDRLGLIIIDEEQEDSYRSESQPRYHATQVAKKRAELTGATLVLGTATPRVDTFFATGDEFTRLSLTRRVMNRQVPAAEIVDMKKELQEGNTSMFSLPLRQALENALQSGEQSILFLNKRGHSSFVFCRKCGFVKRCDDCDVSMTYHRRQDFLICHYCGKTARIPMVCPECASNRIGHFGAGTEQVEAYTRSLFPDARIARMDADTTGTKGAYERFYTQMKERQIDILIGTQMIAKGLDFEGVSLVGILMADISLNLPDYRANEKTYQLISQVSGRSGRGEVPGRVILQTYHPTHFAITTASENDYATFYEKEIVLREHFGYPPFVGLVTVMSSSAEQKKGLQALREITGAVQAFIRARGLDYIRLVGPSPGVIPRIRNRYRHQLVLKFDGHEKEMHAIVDWLGSLYDEKWMKENVNLQYFIE